MERVTLISIEPEKQRIISPEPEKNTAIDAEAVANVVSSLCGRPALTVYVDRPKRKSIKLRRQ